MFVFFIVQVAYANFYKRHNWLIDAYDTIQYIYVCSTRVLKSRRDGQHNLVLGKETKK